MHRPHVWSGARQNTNSGYLLLPNQPAFRSNHAHDLCQITLMTCIMTCAADGRTPPMGAEAGAAMANGRQAGSNPASGAGRSRFAPPDTARRDLGDIMQQAIDRVCGSLGTSIVAHAWGSHPGAAAHQA